MEYYAANKSHGCVAHFVLQGFITQNPHLQVSLTGCLSSRRMGDYNIFCMKSIYF